MGYGYSQRIAALNKRADASSLGVMLGRVCIDTSASVAEVAEALGVSRTTVYNWFVGLSVPHPKHHSKINKLLKRLS